MCQATGNQALELLQHLCANDLDVPVGHIVHTGMLNERGGYENDCSVVRLSKNRWVSLRSPSRWQLFRESLLCVLPAASSWCLPQTSRSTAGPG